MKILIVDDTCDDRSMLRCALEANGHEIMEACNGQEGLQAASAHGFDLILSDVLMPVMDGFRFLRNFRESSGVPFVFYSAAYGGKSDMQLASSLGANGFLIKPMDPVELIKELERIAGQGVEKRPGIVAEDIEYLKKYSQVVASKLEEKVRELEAALAVCKLTEGALAAREREFRTLAENSPDNILRYDTACRMIYVNPRLERTMGIPSAALLGKTPMEKTGSGAFLGYQNKIRWVLATGEDAEIDLVLPDCGDGERYHNVRFVAERGADGGVTGVLAIGRDITERRQAEEQLREKQQRLNDMALELAMSEERERCRVATELHDTLGQDLTLARLRLGLLARSGIPEGLNRMLDGIREPLETAIRRVRRLIRLTSPPILESAGLEAALKWLGRQMENEYGLRVTFSDDQQDKPLPREYQTEIYNGVRELLINVVKHADTESAVLEVSHGDREFAVTVSDNGKGCGTDLASAMSGGGFGLFNLRRRLIHLGGGLRIDSAPGAGTRVTIRMPYTPSQS